jgi:hypothetical protein
VLGFEDEVWWSRVAQPTLSAWSEGRTPLRLVQQAVAKEDPDPKALACYGLLARWADAGTGQHEEAWLRFVDGRPVSAMTGDFLDWCCQKLAVAGKTALLLVWDNASWHMSHAVAQWIGHHNRAVKTAGTGVRIVACRLPSKSPWLNPIEPKWVHGKRRIVEPARLLSTDEVEQRVCAAFGCCREAHLTIPDKAR